MCQSVSSAHLLFPSIPNNRFDSSFVYVPYPISSFPFNQSTLNKDHLKNFTPKNFTYNEIVSKISDANDNNDDDDNFKLGKHSSNHRFLAKKLNTTHKEHTARPNNSLQLNKTLSTPYISNKYITLETEITFKTFQNNQSDLRPTSHHNLYRELSEKNQSFPHGLESLSLTSLISESLKIPKPSKGSVYSTNILVHTNKGVDRPDFGFVHPYTLIPGTLFVFKN